ncbi:hypothetical protein PHYSODRAFT_329736 [Phytophthora sojae]|uniref:Uncharacterized protein n=1 Tax=Phytophthora sojae (strain P6497) TaxID=1094619 RepID=G4Z7T7_PHYSP|nr:hypothetical protein PHYSODRAFT_329736 [Phytophthora sojae]EGZ21840.1 hypothetical protein PHYSODRAFT_329736 [Phytophthora sojae]|eukprot:XP_009524557.1 hypothetical protein PHYSODRAFT_329736 [Phytophthora sojae]
MLGPISDVKVFALSASILYVEDKKLVCNMGIKAAADSEMRRKRVIQNDLESMPLAFVVFWSAIAVGVNPNVTKMLMLAYTTARIGHGRLRACDAASSHGCVTT